MLERMDENVKIDGYEIKRLPKDGIIEDLVRFEDMIIQIIFDDQDYGLYLVKDSKIQEYRSSAIKKLGVANITAAAALSIKYKTDEFFVANKSNINDDLFDLLPACIY